jgi:hypothetical protein
VSSKVHGSRTCMKSSVAWRTYTPRSRFSWICRLSLPSVHCHASREGEPTSDAYTRERKREKERERERKKEKERKSDNEIKRAIKDGSRASARRTTEQITDALHVDLKVGDLRVSEHGECVQC